MVLGIEIAQIAFLIHLNFYAEINNIFGQKISFIYWVVSRFRVFVHPLNFLVVLSSCSFGISSLISAQKKFNSVKAFDMQSTD